MLQIYLHGHEGDGLADPVLLDERQDTLEAVLHELHEFWNEDEVGFQLFWIMDGVKLLATMFRHEDDPEIAVTTYADGRVEQHRCHYVLDVNGRYLETVVTKYPEA